MKASDDYDDASAKAPAIKALKRAFSRSKLATAIKNAAVVKDKKGVRGGKVVTCKLCGKVFPQYQCQVDHIEPVCPVQLSLTSMSLDMLYERLFCEASNLQVVCPTCHQEKSSEERSLRVSWRKQKKYLVCRIIGGSRIKVLPIIDLKDQILKNWEILSVFATRKEADGDAQKRKKI